MLLIVLVCLTGTACAGPSSTDTPLPLASLETFERDVQPHLTARCSSGGCHGRAERPLAFFTPGSYRRDPARTYLDEPLTQTELYENARRLSAFALESDPLRSLAVRKPLAIGQGGVFHEGGENFLDVTDPACRAVVEWLGCRRSPADGGLGDALTDEAR